MRPGRRVLDLLFFDGFRAEPRLMWSTFGLTVAYGVAQAVFPLGFKWFIDALIADDTAAVAVAVAFIAGVITIYWVAAMLETSLGFALVDGMQLFVSTRIAERVNQVTSIEHFERPSYLQELDLLDQNRHLLRAAPRQTLASISSLVRLAAMVVLLASVNPLLAALPLLGFAPGSAQRRSVQIRQHAEERMAEARRVSDELFALSAGAVPAKELRVYGLRKELERRHDALGAMVAGAYSRAAAIGAFVEATGWLVFVVGFTGILGLLVHEAIRGNVTVGDIVLAVVLAQQVRELLALMAGDLGVMFATARTARRLLWLEDYATMASQSDPHQPPPMKLSNGIRLEGVTFRYPGTDSAVLTDVTVDLPAGKSIAIVGENGAGKSTLVKVLCGMYAPTSGRILVEGVDLVALDPGQWRERIGATFQDHVPFELIVGEGVGIGDVPRVDDRPAIERALARADGSDMVAALDSGLDTQLGRTFPGGRELSGGQWQKLALGRGMMREAPLLLILDEPTASLDADTEHSLLERYLAAVHRVRAETGAITIIVTHRLSIARFTDLVVVLDRGVVTEVGSHAELLAANAGYAELFRLQARSYS